MKKNIKKIVSLLIILVIAFIYSHVDNKCYLYDRNQEAGDYIATGILKDEEITQEIVSQDDVFDGIEIKCSVTGSVENVVVSYKLIDNETTEVVATGELAGDEFENSKFYKIAFDRIENSKGKIYTLILSESGTDEMNGIGFSIGEKSNPESGEKLIVRGNETSGILVARTYSHGFDVETFIMFIVFVTYIVVFMKILYKLFK